MLHRTDRTLENLPVGPLGFIPVDGCQELGKKVDEYLVKWRREKQLNDDAVFVDYSKDTCFPPNGTVGGSSPLRPFLRRKCVLSCQTPASLRKRYAAYVPTCRRK